MIALCIGIMIALIGGAIIENAAFSDRAQFGVYVLGVGLLFVIGGGIELLVGWL